MNIRHDSHTVFRVSSLKMISLHRCEEPWGIAQLNSTSEFSQAPWACYRNIIPPNESKLCCSYKSNILKGKCFTFIHNCFSKMKIYHEGGEEMTHWLRIFAILPKEQVQSPALTWGSQLSGIPVPGIQHTL